MEALMDARPIVRLPVETWELDAACAEQGLLDVFFGPDRERHEARLEREARAKAICAGCEVRAPCLITALREQWQGVWGGTNEEERAEIRRRARQHPAGQVRTGGTSRVRAC